MMRVSILFIGCLGWIVGLGTQGAQAGICCHQCPCVLAANPAAGPAAAVVAAPALAATSNAAAANLAPATVVTPLQGVVQVVPQFVVYSFPQGCNPASASQTAPPVTATTVPLQSVLETLQLINTLTGVLTQNPLPAPTKNPAPSALDLVTMQQEITTLQSDVAMLKSRCLSSQGGGTTGNTQVSPLEGPTGAAASSCGSAADLARLAGQVSQLTNAMLSQSKRLDELAADLQQLKGHPSAAAPQSAPLPAPPATAGHAR